MIESILLILTGLVLVSVIISIILLTKSSTAKIETKFDSFDKNQERIEKTLKEELVQIREESSNNSRHLREETINSLKSFNDSLLQNMSNIANLQKDQLDTFSQQLNRLTASNEENAQR